MAASPPPPAPDPATDCAFFHLFLCSPTHLWSTLQPDLPCGNGGMTQQGPLDFVHPQEDPADNGISSHHRACPPGAQGTGLSPLCAPPLLPSVIAL